MRKQGQRKSLLPHIKDVNTKIYITKSMLLSINYIVSLKIQPFFLISLTAVKIKKAFQLGRDFYHEDEFLKIFHVEMKS